MGLVPHALTGMKGSGQAFCGALSSSGRLSLGVGLAGGAP